MKRPVLHRSSPLGAIFAGCLTACASGAPATPPPAEPEVDSPPPDPPSAPIPKTLLVEGGLPAPTPNVSTLPASIRPGELVRVPLPGYRSAIVAHGNADTRRAMIYLHGICGDVERIRDWTAAAATYVTTVAIYGNKPCPTSGARFSWNQDIEFIHELAQLALTKVAQARHGQLDVDGVVVFGYSQGASRAERLVERYPERYPWLILGGPPAPPLFERVRGARRTAILVGSEEHQEHLSEVAATLSSLGAPTRFDTFPGVGHGGFGSKSPAVVTNALRWLLEP